MISLLRTQHIELCTRGVVCYHVLLQGSRTNCPAYFGWGALATDSSCLEYGGCSGTLETGHNLGTPFLSVSLLYLRETCWVTQSLGRHPVNPFSSGECLRRRSPYSNQVFHDYSYGCHPVCSLGRKDHPRAAQRCGLWDPNQGDNDKSSLSF